MNTFTANSYDYKYFLQSDVCRLCWKANACIEIYSENKIHNSLTNKINDLLNIDLTRDLFLNKICLSCQKNIEDFYYFKCVCKENELKLRVIWNSTHENASETKVYNNSTSDDYNSIDVTDLLEITNSDGETAPHRKVAKGKRKNHLKNRKPKYTCLYFCTVCRIDLITSNDYDSHNAKLHGIIDKKYQCHGCKMSFNLMQERQNHEFKCKDISNGFRCICCEKQFAKRRLYDTHLRGNKCIGGHLGEKSLKCKKCKIKFKTKECYKQHNLQAHKKNFVCESCGRVFHRQDYLHKHKLVHSGVKQHACPHCDMRFTQRSSLTVHKRKHTGERPFKCDMCPHRCVTSSNLIEHRRRHLGVKKHECSFCDKKFGYKRSLEEHIASVHERSLPHPCPHCGTNYTNKRGLRRHLLTKHPTVPTGESSNKEKEQPPAQDLINKLPIDSTSAPTLFNS